MPRESCGPQGGCKAPSLPGAALCTQTPTEQGRRKTCGESFASVSLNLQLFLPLCKAGRQPALVPHCLPAPSKNILLCYVHILQRQIYCWPTMVGGSVSQFIIIMMEKSFEILDPGYLLLPLHSRVGGSSVMCLFISTGTSVWWGCLGLDFGHTRNQTRNYILNNLWASEIA